MALKHVRPSSLRLAFGLTLACSMTIIGCQSLNATDVKPASLPAGATPSHSVGSTAMTGEALPLGTPAPNDNVPFASPSASVDSDLPQEDSAAIESLVESDELKAYLPNSLIHDGGVILYQALGLSPSILDLAATASAVRQTICNGPAAPPENWHRTSLTAGARHLKVRRVPGNSKQATVEVRWQTPGTISYRDVANGKAVHKNFNETDKRSILLERTGSRWHAISLSPLSSDSQAGHSGLELQQVRLFRGQETTPVLVFDELEPLLSLAEKIPTFMPGESVRVEVEVRDKLACPLFVYAHLVGGTNHTRERLLDDGQSGDRRTDDGIYAGTFFVPAVAGVHHIAIDVLEPTVFAPGGVYRSNGLAMNFKVQAIPAITSSATDAATPAAKPSTAGL